MSIACSSVRVARKTDAFLFHRLVKRLVNLASDLAHHDARTAKDGCRRVVCVGLFGVFAFVFLSGFLVMLGSAVNRVSVVERVVSL